MNLDVQNTWVAEHCKELQREAEQRRLAAQLAGHHGHPGRHAIAGFGKSLVAFGLWLEQIERNKELAR